MVFYFLGKRKGTIEISILNIGKENMRHRGGWIETAIFFKVIVFYLIEF